MRKNFRFTDKEYMANDKRSIFFKRNRMGRKIIDEEFEVEADVQEKKTVDVDENESKNEHIDHSKGLAFWHDEVYSKISEEISPLPEKIVPEELIVEESDTEPELLSKSPKFLGIIDEDMLLLGVTAIVLQSPRKDFSLLPLILLLTTSKQR